MGLSRLAQSLDVIMQGAQASGPWYLSGGISAANCVWAYLPKGAADLATSYVNLANPGTYNATPRVAPSLSSGWVFTGTQWLTNTYKLQDTSLVIVQFNNNSGTGYLFSQYKTTGGEKIVVGIVPNLAGVVRYVNGNAYTGVAPVLNSGNLAVGNGNGYRNGIANATIANSTLTSDQNFAIGAQYPGYGPYSLLSATIVAIAAYIVAPNDTQVAAVSTAMAAL